MLVQQQQQKSGRYFEESFKTLLAREIKEKVRHHMISVGLRRALEKFPDLPIVQFPNYIYLPCPTKPIAMATSTHRASTFLLFPWGLASILLLIILNLTLNDDWFNKNWSWIALVLIIPAAILENFKVGYSTMRIMFLKVLFSLLSFLFAGMAFGSALTNYYNIKWGTGGPVKAITLPWYVLLALIVLLLIQVAQLFSMLKAVKREFMQMDPDQ